MSHNVNNSNSNSSLEIFLKIPKFNEQINKILSNEAWLVDVSVSLFFIYVHDVVALKQKNVCIMWYSWKERKT